MKTIDNLINDMRNHGININSVIADSKFHRCTEIKAQSSKKKPCWYIAHDNGTSMVVSYGNFKTNTQHVWSNQSKSTEYEREILKRHVHMVRQNQLQEQQTSLTQLQNDYDSCTDICVDNHPYMIKKQISQLVPMSLKHKLRLDASNNLVIPILNIQDQLQGYQKISATGDKRFAKGTIKKGNYYPIIAESLNLTDVNIFAIGEGLATMGSIYFVMNELYDGQNIACLVALDVGNIEPVLLQLWGNGINKPIILIADNDFDSTINIGKDTCDAITRKYKHKSLNTFLPQQKDIL